MPVPGYDPEDIDELLDSLLEADDLQAYLSEGEIAAYDSGDESLIDLLSGSEIREILREKDAPVEL